MNNTSSTNSGKNDKNDGKIFLVFCLGFRFCGKEGAAEKTRERERDSTKQSWLKNATTKIRALYFGTMVLFYALLKRTHRYYEILHATWWDEITSSVTWRLFSRILMPSVPLDGTTRET